MQREKLTLNRVNEFYFVLTKWSMFFSSTSSYIASASDIDLCCWCCSHLETHLSRLIETNLFLSAFLSFMCEMFYVLKNEESSQSRRWLKSWQRDLKRSWNEQGYNIDTWIYVHSFKQSQFSGECRSVFNILFELQYSHWDTIKYQQCFSLLHSFVWRRIKDQMKNSYIRVRVQTWFVNERRWCRDVWICI